MVGTSLFIYRHRHVCHVCLVVRLFLVSHLFFHVSILVVPPRECVSVVLVLFRFVSFHLFFRCFLPLFLLRFYDGWIARLSWWWWMGWNVAPWYRLVFVSVGRLVWMGLASVSHRILLHPFHSIRSNTKDRCTSYHWRTEKDRDVRRCVHGKKTRRYHHRTVGVWW